MINVVFFNAKTFLSREVKSVIDTVPWMRVVNVDLPQHVNPDAVDVIFEQIRPYLPGLVFSLNCGGFDYQGKLHQKVVDSGSFIVNWFYDDPFFDSIFFGNRISAHKNRIEFVSEPTFLPALRKAGHQAFFMPLAADPAYFNTDKPRPPYERDVAFVGTSSLEFVDEILGKSLVDELEQFGGLMKNMREMYEKNPTTDLRRYLLDNKAVWSPRITIDEEKFLFSMQWMVEYLHRRDFIVDIAKTYGDRFTCFGDIYWSKFLPKEQVSTDARYYTNLCDYYRSTKINLNLNRIQIRTAFTQRVFDTKACGAFLLTQRRALNEKFFVTAGPDRELVEFDSRAQCKELIDYYREHGDEREAIASAGREKVLANHTYERRLEQILGTCKDVWKF